jgi:adenylate cyclase
LERRLAAILAADVVGYSRLMGADEAGTLERLMALRKELVQPQISGRGGRIVKLMGDGLLAEFPSVVEAVQCAADIQEAMTGREAEAAEALRIALRIGVNLGDVIVEGSDLYGDGVNVAARLEALAEPGGVCVSGTVFDHVDGKVELDFADLGEQRVKNIDQPVQVYRIVWEGSADPGASPGATAMATPPAPAKAADKPSIAVLPFTNMSGDPEQEYFSDGITEDIITELSRFKDLSVVSRNSSFAFKGKAASLREVGERLGVTYLVEGSIRKAGNTVRVTAQLIDAQNDNHIWAERYDRSLEDIFEVQDDVVRRVASTLVGRLEHERQVRTRRQSESQLQAYDLYLRGRELFFNWTKEDNAKARDFLAAAIAIEPDHAAALALTAEVRLRMWLNGWSEDPEQDRAESFEAAKRAIAVDDQDSRVHTAIGLLYIWNRNLDRARHHFETASGLRRRFRAGHRALPPGSEPQPLCQVQLQPGHCPLRGPTVPRGHRVPGHHRRPPGPDPGPAGCQPGHGGRHGRGRCQLCPLSRLRRGLSGHHGDWRAYFSERWPFRNADDTEHLLQALAKAGFPL